MSTIFANGRVNLCLKRLARHGAAACWVLAGLLLAPRSGLAGWPEPQHPRLQIGHAQRPSQPYGYFPTKWTRWPWEPAAAPRRRHEPAAAEDETEEPSSETPPAEAPPLDETLPAPPSEDEALPPLQLPTAPAAGESTPPGELTPPDDTTPKPPSDDEVPALPPTLPSDLSRPDDQARHQKIPRLPQLRRATTDETTPQVAQKNTPRSTHPTRTVSPESRPNVLPSVWSGFEPLDRGATARIDTLGRPMVGSPMRQVPDGRRSRDAEQPSLRRRTATARFSNPAEGSASRHRTTRLRNQPSDARGVLPGIHDPRQLRNEESPRGSNSSVTRTRWMTHTRADESAASTNPLRRASHQSLRPRVEPSRRMPRGEPLRRNPLR